jgi:geranylgeranyl diphosphate synthase type II
MTARPDSSSSDPFACLGAIEAFLDRRSGALDLPPMLVQAIRYSLLSGGKRVRPVLAWHAARAVGATGEASLCVGAAIELVHTFSLVHDDLPAMDNDDLRRGKATLHIHAGEAMAILASDAMLAIAFGMLGESGACEGIAALLTRELAEATTGMIAGQVHDTLGGLPEATSARQRLETIHRNKTGALIRAACRMGALAGHAALAAGRGDAGFDAESAAGSPGVVAVTRYGEAIGLMFQIVDDLLDATGTIEQIGKRTRKDADAGKLTYPGVMGIEGSRREIERLHREAQEALAPLGGRDGPAGALARLAEALATRES